ncbi:MULTISPECIES: sensor histidine kinase [unclassified Crossiella]|uniref:sensor histidine kinase n=1 Tax=unclassified Crossiella TaxID=2620835 RepID=UPI001FFFC57C|nr:MULTISPECIES: sensor histidine kinase [unclassified Crossiella]MCK2243215.1 sensor histidine kinase [Crossiella sp. S99.2]MCK2254316.1 sensor histidine kinase [Crossiella sp. S99.1]
MGREYVTALGRALRLLGLAVAGLAVLLFGLLCFLPAMAGLIFYYGWGLRNCRPFLNRVRAVVSQWSGTEIVPPYRPRPPLPERDADGLYRLGDSLYRSRRRLVFQHNLAWVSDDPATWRDLRWLLVNPVLALLTALATVLAGPRALRVYSRWTAHMLGVHQPSGENRFLQWLFRGWEVSWRGFLLGLLALAGLPILVANLLGFLLYHVLGMWQFWWPPLVEYTRQFTDLHRRLLREWAGIEVPDPYLPVPLPPRPEPDGKYRYGNQLFSTAGPVRRMRRYVWVMTDRAAWRDLLWLLANTIVAPVLVLLPPLAAMAGLLLGAWLPLVISPVLSLFFDRDMLPTMYQWMPLDPVPTTLFRTLGPLIGLPLAVCVVYSAPALLTGYGRWCALLLAPTKAALLAQRVRRLTESRTEAVHGQAAELRRIERDLHDGAQARLVALGLSLGTAKALVDTDPARAKEMLDQALASSSAALTELRDLVAGIHPPVLAERGLADAVHAVALDAALPVRLEGSLPGRFEPPVESAAYFAVCELMTNAIRHAGADTVVVHLAYSADTLRISVVDNGCGGADPAGGSGLRGIRRRLGAFDGQLILDSPPGGPTTVSLEIPCALSSPRTSTSSETA